jgi:glyceraldehyde 3-phosphate dehydrogenase
MGYTRFMVKIAINGFGRIGRGFARAIQDRPEFELVAVNDITPVDNLAYLLKYDTVYGPAKFDIASDESGLVIKGKKVRVTAEKEPGKLPWKELSVDIVIESTGLFTDAEKARGHIAAGAKRVVVSAPGKGDGIETILVGAN